MRHTLQRLITFETGCGNGYGHSVANTRVKCKLHTCGGFHGRSLEPIRKREKKDVDATLGPPYVSLDLSLELINPLLTDSHTSAHFIVSPRPPFHGSQVASDYSREQSTLLYKASLFRHARCFQSYKPYQREKKSPR